MSAGKEESHAILAEATVQELADLALRKDGYAVGDVLDIRDTVQKWMEGRIVQVDPTKGYYINYLGWSEKWNEWVPKNSPRLAPHRSYTTKSTAPAQNAGAYQLDGENLVKFRGVVAKFAPIVAKAKAAEGKDPPKGVDNASELTDAEWQVIVTEVCPMVNNALNSVVNDLTAVPDVARFFLDYIAFIIYLLRMDRDIRPVVLESFMRVLNSEPTAADRKFFSKYGVSGTESWDNGNKGKYAIRPKSTGAGDSLKVTSAYLVLFVNTFGDAGGFDLMAKRIALEGDAAPSFYQLLIFANILRTDALFEPKLTKKFIPGLKWDVKTILAKIEATSDDELKTLTRDGLRLSTNNLIELLIANKEIKMKSAEAASHVQLAVIYRLLKSTILEKRLNGLLEMQDLVRVLRMVASARGGNLIGKAKQDVDALPPCYTSTPLFLAWVDKFKIVQMILSQDSHEEVLKRSPVFLKFLAANNALSVEHIFNLFDSALGGGGKHEGFVRIVYDLVADVSSELPDQTLDALIAKLASIPTKNYTEVYMHFLQKLATMCSKQNVARATPLLLTFWELITSTNGSVTPECSQLAIAIFADLFRLQQFDTQRIPHVEKAMKALMVVDAPVLKLLRFLINTLATFPTHSDATQWNQDSLILALDGKLQLTKIFFDELQRYHTLATTTFAALPAEERTNTNVLVAGGVSHHDNLDARLGFLQYCLERSKQLPITAAHIDILWRVLYTEAVTPSDSNQLFRWLINLVDDGAADAGSTTRRRPFSSLSGEVMKHTFQLLLNKTNFETLTYEAYKCIEVYFCYVNYLMQNLVHASKKHLQVLQPQSVHGLDRLWLLAATATDRKIIVTSRILLVSLYTKLDPKLSGRRPDVYTMFLDRCMQDLHVYRTSILAGQDVANNTRVALQYLLILDVFLNSCDKFNQPPEEAAVPGGPAHEPKPALDLKSPDVERNFHRYQLSNRKEYFSQLFELLSLGGEIATRVWQLFSKLPTNEEFEQKIINISAYQSAPAEETVDWPQLFASNSTIKMLYVLNIVHAFLSHGDRPKLQAGWVHVFLERGGFAYIAGFVQNIQLDAMLAEGVLSHQCLASLLKLMCSFMQFPAGTATTDAATDYSRLVPQLVQMIEKYVLLPVNDADANSNVADAPLVLNAFLLLSHCLSRLPVTSPLMEGVATYAGWDSILAVALDHQHARIRDQTADGLDTLCQDPAITDQSSTTEQFQTSPNAPRVAKLISAFLPKLLNMLQHIETRSTRCGAYFMVTRKLLLRAPTYAVPVDAAALVAHLTAKVKAQPILEMRATDEDIVLAGFLHLLQELLRQQPELKTSCGELIQELYDDLFQLPTTENTTTSGSAVIPPPQCKSAYTRRSAFQLLDELVFESPVNLQRLVTLLLPHHYTSHSNGKHTDDSSWDFESKADEKSECGYVGLRNHGAICYLNSTVQQFFMIPEFRRELLSAKANVDEPPHLSVLYQLQSIMAFLQESEKQSFDPLGLCKSFVDYDGNPLNVGVQEDAAGFVTRLIDKVMETVKGTSNADALKSAIYGQTVDQFIGHPPRCTHRKERTEEFATIGLSVRNMKSILDSLKSFVSGEDMIGSNAYKCAICDSKVDTTKRTVFSKLPPTLIFNLKRFEMNFETMRSVKVNDRLEFPLTLNMKPYTREGIEAQQKGDGNTTATNDTQDGEQHPDSYYEYELTGVTVHTGSMDRGHYYSFIQERPNGPGQGGRWMEFNDTVVRPFDPRSIADECYGGLERVQQFNAAGRSVEQTVEKQRNAYLLFYTRKQSIPEDTATETNGDVAMQTETTPKSTALALAAGRVRAPIPPEIFDIVAETNRTYWRDRYVFDPTYFEFLYAVCFRALQWLPQMAEREAASSPSASQVLADYDNLYSLVAQLSTRFVIETLCRSRQKQLVPNWTALLTTAYQTSVPACQWFLTAMRTDLTAWTTDVLLSCPVPEVRLALATLISQVIQRLTETNNEEALHAYIDSLVGTLRVVPEWWRRFNAYFRVLQFFATLRAENTQYLIQKHDFLAMLADAYLGPSSPLADNPFQGPINPQTKQRQIIGDTIVRPDMTAFLGLLTRLVCASETIKPGSNPPSRVVGANGALLPLSPAAVQIYQAKIFWTRLVSDATSRRRGEHIGVLLQHLCWENIEFTKTIVQVVVTGIKTDQVDTLRPYFRVIGGLLTIADSLQATRQDMVLQSLLLVLENQSGFWKPTDFCLEHFIRLAKKHPVIPAWVAKHTKLTDWVVTWLRAHPLPPRQNDSILMHKPGRADPTVQMQSFNVHDYAAFTPKCWPSLSYTSQQKLAIFERLRQEKVIDTSYGSDSDEELNERVFQLGEYVDCLDTVAKWLVARIVEVSSDGKHVKVHFQGWSPKYDEVLPSDSSRLTKFGRFSTGQIVEEPASATPGLAALHDAANADTTMTDNDSVASTQGASIP